NMSQPNASKRSLSVRDLHAALGGEHVAPRLPLPLQAAQGGSSRPREYLTEREIEKLMDGAALDAPTALNVTVQAACRRKVPRSSRPPIGWTLGCPPLRTCSLPVRKSTSSQRKATSSLARSPWR